jgi:hypothetical protein
MNLLERFLFFSLITNASQRSAQILFTWHVRSVISPHPGMVINDPSFLLVS